MLASGSHQDADQQEEQEENTQPAYEGKSKLQTSKPSKPSERIGKVQPPEQSNLFDYRTHRQKYQIVEGETTKLFDAGADEIVDMST
jgi:hypothetical protein